MELAEYRSEFIDELRFNAEHDGSEPESQFINWMLEKLEDIGELNDPYPVSIVMKGRRGRKMAFDAYAYDEADNSLILISSYFSNTRDNAPTLTNTQIEDMYKHMVNFVDEAVNGHMSDYCDDSDDAITIAKEFAKKIGTGTLNTEINRFKFYIISDAVRSTQVKSIERENFLDRPVEICLWTIDRIFQTFASNSSEIIKIDTADFNCPGIPCLKADIGQNADYDAYLGIVPGQFLADIYLKYGSKLLQGNVRAFLSVRGKVNKGIRDTIMNRPRNFFTYNNGIAVVARSVTFSKDGSKIISFSDPQIINGGQTTASLANAVIKKEDKNGMGAIFVPMKLTVLNVEDEMTEEQTERYNEITKTISQCANSQNAVSEADFFSNHPFHILMENLSHKVMAPPVDGKPYQTIWFYERSRGKWEQEQMKMSPAERKRFGEMNPKTQVIKKEKLAKCLNAVRMNPHQVCQSSAINFSKFATYIEDLYTTSRDSINEEFFKKGVCSVILFDQLDKIIGKADWYPKGGNKAQIVPYTIAKLFTLLPKGMDIDWRSIWQKQRITSEMAEELERLAYFTHKHLEKEAKGGLVRSMCRVEATWSNFRKVRYELSDNFLKSLVSSEIRKSDEASATRAHKFNSEIDASVEIFSLGTDYWMNVYHELLKESVLSFGELEFIKGIASYIKRTSLPSAAQCKRLIRIINKAEDNGYIMPQ